jgi:nitroimidazol reductase NimA-like FMN-containing flavoprotein (pyridoxamine 5'-phosphate oxidase superfamily)
VEEHVDLKDQIQRVLDRNRFAVLATQHAGQPHASLMAFTPMSGVRYLVFATYRGTLKHRNLLEDRRVAVLIDDGDAGGTHPNRRRVLTALGDAIEIPDEERQAAVSDHLARHPDLEEFVRRTVVSHRGSCCHLTLASPTPASAGLGRAVGPEELLQGSVAP